MNENSKVNKVALPRYSQHFIPPRVMSNDFALQDSPSDKYSFVKTKFEPVQKNCMKKP